MRIHSLAQQLQHQQQQQQLWRPSEQVLHLLTECKQAPVVLEEKPSSSLLLSSSSSDDPKPMNVKRQAPTVWRPPVAMKANCPPPQPLPAPVDDWKLPPQEQAEPKLLDPFTFLAGEDDQHHRQEQTQPPQVLNNASDEDEDDVDPGDPDVHDHSQLNQKNSEGLPDELMPSSKIFSLASPAEISLGSQNLFMKQQQVVASTPLFAGLGSVSFGSGFSAPATSTIFCQSHGFGSGLIFSQKQGLISSQQQQQQPEEEEMADDQIQPAMVVKNSRFQRPGVSERGASFSEKGSSDSQSGKIRNKNSRVNVKVVDAQSKSGNGGFKPSGLAGKSLVIDPIDLLGGKAAAATSGRKLRTRTLDLLVNAIQTTAPKSLQQQQQQQQENGSQAALPRTRSSSRTTPGASKLSNNSSSNMMTKNSSDHQNDDASAGRSAGKKPGAYFAHAGAWIVQKKSSRNAKNAFKKESVEVKEAPDRRAGKKKEEEDDQQSIIPPRTKKSKPAAKSTPAMRNGNQSATEGKTATTKLTKKRSLTAMSQEATTTTKHQKPPSKKKKKKKDDDDYREEEQSNGGDESRGPGRPSKAAAPLIRSKRGRCQVLPNRLQDSVMNKVKKTSRT